MSVTARKKTKYLLLLASQHIPLHCTEQKRKLHAELQSLLSYFIPVKFLLLLDSLSSHFFSLYPTQALPKYSLRVIYIRIRRVQI